jgi:hypothetical protein
MNDREGQSFTYDAPDGNFSYQQWESDDGMVHSRSRGIQDVDACRHVHRLLEEATERCGRRLRVLVDISELTDCLPPARQYMMNHLHGPGAPAERVAFVGANRWLRHMLNLYALVAANPFRVFAAEEQALSWLKEGRPDE